MRGRRDGVGAGRERSAARGARRARWSILLLGAAACATLSTGDLVRTHRSAAVEGASEKVGAETCTTCHDTVAGHAPAPKYHAECESCHGPGDKHVAAMRAANPDAAKMKKLGDLDGDDITQNMCGSCHRSVEDVMALPNRGGINNVRFQPYRIFNSRCYSADKRIGCTACHNPHEPTQTSPAFYDARCQACHLKQDAKPAPATGKLTVNDTPFARGCRVGKKDCAGCHMPAIELSGAHFKFTDHRIRIVREGAPFPN